MSGWTQPICDGCFGELFDTTPYRMVQRELEKCCWCGLLGIENGIYIRINPSFAHYPS